MPVDRVVRIHHGPPEASDMPARRKYPLAQAQQLQKFADLKVRGYSTKECAEALGIDYKTARSWAVRKPVQDQIKRFKERGVELVELSMASVLHELAETAKEARDAGKPQAAVGAYATILKAMESSVYREEIRADGEDLVEAQQDSRDLEAELVK